MTENEQQMESDNNPQEQSVPQEEKKDELQADPVEDEVSEGE